MIVTERSGDCTLYRVECDECGAPSEAAGTSRENAELAATDCGFRTDGDVHYCPECDQGWVE